MILKPQQFLYVAPSWKWKELDSPSADCFISFGLNDLKRVKRIFVKPNFHHVAVQFAASPQTVVCKSVTNQKLVSRSLRRAFSCCRVVAPFPITFWVIKYFNL